MSLFVALQDPIVQKFVVRFVGGYLSEKTGADIKVGRLVVTSDLQAFVDDVVVKDLRGNELAEIERLRAKVFVGDILEGKIHIGLIVLRNAKANLVQYEGEDAFNFQFLADFFSSEEEKPESKPLLLEIDHIIIANLDFLLWNQNTDEPEAIEQKAIDYSHIDIDSLYLDVKNLLIIGDSIHAVVEMLKAKEMSGFIIKSLQSDVIVGQSGIYLTDLQLETNNSLIHTDLNMLYDGFGALGNFVDSVRFDATIYPSDIMLSDIGVFSPVLYEMPDRVFFQGRFTGPVEHFLVDIDEARIGRSTSFKGKMSMHPLDFENGEHTLNISRMRFTYTDIANFKIPSGDGTIPLPESLSAMNSGTMSLNFKGSYNNFNSRIRLLSDIGNVEVNVGRKRLSNGDNIFSGDIMADKFNAGLMANASKFVGNLDLNANFSARFPHNGDLDLTVNGKAYRAQLLGHHIDEVVLNGEMKENLFSGEVVIEDNDLDLEFNGLIDFENKKYPRADFAAIIRYADLSALKLMKNDSVSEIRTNIVANLTGFDIDNMVGELHLDSTVFHDSRGVYVMRHFDASIDDDKYMSRRINIKNDFFDFEMKGEFNFANLKNSFFEYGDSFVHFPIFQKDLDDFRKYKLKNDVSQDFVLSLALKDTKTVSRLLMPNLKVAKNTTVSATFSSKANQFTMSAHSKFIKIGDVNINNVELRNYNVRSAAFGSLSIGEVAWVNVTKTDTVSYGLDNILLTAKLADDTISSRIQWDDVLDSDLNKGKIETYFHPHENGGIFSIKEADIRINDSLWHVMPNNYVDIQRDKIALSNILFSHNNQSIRIDGFVPGSESDTLSVQLQNFDVSNFDVVFNRMGFDCDGFISGDALLSGLRMSPMLLANLNIDRFGVDGEEVGNVLLTSSWDNENKAVDLELCILDQEKQVLNVDGFYYTARKHDNLDFTVELNDLSLNALNPLLAGVVSRLQGSADGWLTLNGSVNQPVVEGRIKVDDGGCKVDYLNTYYTFTPTILVDSRSIVLDDLVLVDTLGNRAYVEGKITHNSFKDFNLDIRLYPRQFLAMATTSKDNDTFYGTAIANGLVDVKGPFDDIYLSVKALTQKGTKVTIPISRSTTVKDNDFIVFVQPPKEAVEDEEEELVEEEETKKRNFTLNLDIDVTDDADLTISLPGIGVIDATGNGNMKIGTSSNTAFSLIGDYVINDGQFQLNFRNLVTRNFDLKKGGTIVFTGDPLNGRIDATGAYNVKAALETLGVEIDSTSSSSNVNVECLIHLKNALLNPDFTFGMNLPNASEDVQQTVYALVDTTNQAVMTQQAMSLLLMGTFSYAGNTANNNTTDYFSAITSSLLFQRLSVNITDNVNVGFRYHATSAENSFDEYQFATRSEFFDSRMTLETNVGLVSASNASQLIGEFDLYWKLTKDGRLQAHFYNHSNYNSNFSAFSFDRLAPYTRGLGLSYSRSFDRFSDFFRKKKSFSPSSGPMMGKQFGKDKP